MTTTVILIVLFGQLVPLAIGVWLGRRQRLPPNDADIARYMNRVVNIEELEERQRINKFRMARNGRKTQRFDGGPNAKIMRMRIRPVSRRFRK